MLNFNKYAWSSITLFREFTYSVFLSGYVNTTVTKITTNFLLFFCTKKGQRQNTFYNPTASPLYYIGFCCLFLTFFSSHYTAILPYTMLRSGEYLTAYRTTQVFFLFCLITRIPALPDKRPCDVGPPGLSVTGGRLNFHRPAHHASKRNRGCVVCATNCRISLHNA